MGRALLSIKPGTIGDLVDEISGQVIALTTQGIPRHMDEVALKLTDHRKPVLLVGGFPSGHFSAEALSRAEESYRIHDHGLEAATVVARAIYDYERATKVGEARHKTSLM